MICMSDALQNCSPPSSALNFADQSQQDKLDAATIYSMLENEIIPLYFAKNSKGYVSSVTNAWCTLPVEVMVEEPSESSMFSTLMPSHA